MVAGVELLVECCPSFRDTDNSSTRPHSQCSSPPLVRSPVRRRRWQMSDLEKPMLTQVLA
jgi:hypothetical protein